MHQDGKRITKRPFQPATILAIAVLSIAVVGKRPARLLAQCSPFQNAKLVAPDATSFDLFGNSVDLDGNTAVVGAVFNRHTVGLRAGSAYIFVRGGMGGWQSQAKLTASDSAPDDQFGNAVAVHGDNVIIGAWHDDHSGASDAGSAYVFRHEEGVWTEQAKLIASDAAEGDLFGRSVALYGNTALVGAFRDGHSGLEKAGSAYVFERTPGGWIESAKLTATDASANDLFGYSVALDNDTAIVGSRSDTHAGGSHAGSAYVFVRTGAGWTEQAKLTASDSRTGDQFGESVALHGDTAVIGARTDDLPGGLLSGSAYVFVRDGDEWLEQAKLTASDARSADFFGNAVAVHGNTVVIAAWADDHAGGADAGSAYVFLRSGAVWVERAKLIAADGSAGDLFGGSVALDGNSVLIGARNNDHSGLSNPGSAYEFVHGCPVEGPGLDIRPRVCPNALDVRARGFLEVGLLGSVGFDVQEVELNTVRLARADGVGGQIAPHNAPPGPPPRVADVTAPFDLLPCDCRSLPRDGFDDLVMHFRAAELVSVLQLNGLAGPQEVQLVLSGTLASGEPFSAFDCVQLVGPGFGSQLVDSDSRSRAQTRPDPSP